MYATKVSTESTYQHWPDLPRRTLPELSDTECFGLRRGLRLSDMPDKVSNELLLERQRCDMDSGWTHRDMLDGIESESVSAGFLQDPFSPFPACQLCCLDEV